MAQGKVESGVGMIKWRSPLMEISRGDLQSGPTSQSFIKLLLCTRYCIVRERGREREREGETGPSFDGAHSCRDQGGGGNVLCGDTSEEGGNSEGGLQRRGPGLIPQGLGFDWQSKGKGPSLWR